MHRDFRCHVWHHAGVWCRRHHVHHVGRRTQPRCVLGAHRRRARSGVLHADVEVLNVSVEVVLQTGDMQCMQVMGNYSGGSAMLTDGTGRAMNAVGFDLSGADVWVRPVRIRF